MSRVADHLGADDRLLPNGLILYGHSRRAKAVLLAAARDSRFAMVLSLQSGTGGASLHGDGVGEPAASISQSYPHWFARRYAGYAHDENALPVDAHHLLAFDRAAPGPAGRRHARHLVGPGGRLPRGSGCTARLAAP